MADVDLRDLERRHIAEPDDVGNNDRLSAAYIRAGRSEAAFVISYPELSSFVDIGYPEAQATLADLIQPDDVQPPPLSQVRALLCEDFRANPEHLVEIGNMKKPVFQLVPVFTHEGAGFRRMVQNLDAHPIQEQETAYIDTDSRLRWRMDRTTIPTASRIVGWKLAITEGGDLNEASNPYLGEPLHEQFRLAKEDYFRRKLRITNKYQYALLQKQALGLPGATRGIDSESWSVLDDPSLEGEPLVLGGGWNAEMVFFDTDNEEQAEHARFRPSVVVDVPREL